MNQHRLTKIPMYIHLCPLEAAELIIINPGVIADKPECEFRCRGAAGHCLITTGIILINDLITVIHCIISGGPLWDAGRE